VVGGGFGNNKVNREVVGVGGEVWDFLEFVGDDDFDCVGRTSEIAIVVATSATKAMESGGVESAARNDDEVDTSHEFVFLSEHIHLPCSAADWIGEDLAEANCGLVEVRDIDLVGEWMIGGDGFCH